MVHRVYALGAPKTGIENTVFGASLGEILPLLKAEGYDYIIDLHHNLRSLRVKTSLRAPAFSFDKLNWQKWLLVRLGIHFLPKKHIVERYMATTEPLGVQYDGQGLNFHYPAQQAEHIAHRVAQISAAWQQQPFVAFVIGATHATKRLPISKIIEICGQIPYPVVLVGGPSEQASGDAIAAAAGNHVVNTSGQLSLFESAFLIEKATVVVTHDTGMMHIAAALGKRIVSVWGNTIPEFGMYPFYAAGQSGETRVEVANLPCRPCSKIGHQKCPRGHFKCMQNIPIDAIIEGVVKAI